MDFNSQLYQALWSAFKLPFAIFFGFILLKALIAPIYKAIIQIFGGRK